jgi:RNA polymerase sigma-70 factor (ECF subfamily)
MRTPSTDHELLTRLQGHDEDALAELIDVYGPRIYQLAFRYLRNKEDAEEITQDVIFKVYRKIDAFRGDAALSSWIYRITFNASMSRLRSLKHKPASTDESQSTPTSGGEHTVRKEPADWSELADEHVFRKELRRRIYRAILALPAIYRAPVMLRDLQGLSTEEASAVLRVKDQTLKSRLHRGRVILRKQLADFAGGVALHRAA